MEGGRVVGGGEGGVRVASPLSAGGRRRRSRAFKLEAVRGEWEATPRRRRPKALPTKGSFPNGLKGAGSSYVPGRAKPERPRLGAW